VQIDWFTFAAQIINLLILIWLLHRFLYRPVIKAMDEREQKIASELEGARLKKVAAEEKEREYQQKVKNIEMQKEQLLDEARKEASEQRKELMKEIRTEIADIEKRWEEAVEGEKEAFLNQLQQETSEQIIILINNILVDLTDQSLQDQTVNIFLEKIKELNAEDKARLQETLQEFQTQQVNVFSTFELKGEQKHALADVIRKTSGTELEFEFEVTKNLGFGLEVRVGGWNIGWSLKRYLGLLRSNMDKFFAEQSPTGKISELK